MSERVVLRTAGLADVPAMLEIYAPFVRETSVSFELVVPTPAEFAARVGKSQERHAWLVAADAVTGEIAGYAYAGAFRAREAYRFSAETSVYLRPSAEGRGIAARLYRELLARLAEQGYCTAYAGIALPNDRSLVFHRALGFSEIGVFARAGRKFGAWHDVSWWQLRLREEPLEEPLASPTGE